MEAKKIPIHNKHKFRIGHAEIDIVTLEDAVRLIIDYCGHKKSAYVVTPNVDHILLLEKDEEFQQAYRDAFLVTCDGMPILWASKILGCPLPERVSGSDLMPALCKEASQRNLSVAVIGGPPGAAEGAKENLAKSYPGLNIVWTFCPPFGFEHSHEITNDIVNSLNRLQPDLVFLGVGAPKQEKWIHQHRDEFKCGAILGIGASIEFAAGTLKRAPKIWQRLGFEWLYRLLQDPRRLGPRYLGNFRFFIFVAKLYIDKLLPKNKED